jgi:hypothetical protein
MQPTMTRVGAMRRFFSRDFPGISASLVFKILTLSYSGALKYHTTDPIKLMEANCDYKHQRDDVMHAISQFRQVKQEELRFVNNAARKAPGANQDIEEIINYFAPDRPLYQASP